MAGPIAELLSFGARGGHEQASAFEPAASHHEGLCRYEDPAASVRPTFQALGSTPLARADDLGAGNARQEPDPRRPFQVLLVGFAKVRWQRPWLEGPARGPRIPR